MNPKLRKTEERILRFLKLMHKHQIYIRLLSTKLEIDYSYLIGILKRMENKLWIEMNKEGGKTYCRLTESAPLTENMSELEYTLQNNVELTSDKPKNDGELNDD